MPDIEDLILWPDGTICFRYELAEVGSGKSDDYEEIPYDSQRYHQLLIEHDLY